MNTFRISKLRKLANFPFRLVIFLVILATQISPAQKLKRPFAAIAFFTAKNDAAHISFVKEANTWFAEKAQKYRFVYDTTSNWNNLNADILKDYKVVIFFDTRPEKPEQRAAFEKYMKNGGAWMGFHFSAFALNNSQFPQNWDWYHKEFLGSEEYKSNTWRPTSAILKNEKGFIKSKFKSAPNEWYRWTGNLRKNKDIEVLLSIHPKSFPLGTGHKPPEIWHEGDYPVAWRNKNYKMVYFNMGHNEMDYESGTNETLSSTFSSKKQNDFILKQLFKIGKSKRIKSGNFIK